MDGNGLLNRRGFIAAGTAVLAAGTPKIRTYASEIPKANDPFKGLKVGLASYSTRKFSLDKTIEMMKRMGVRYVTLKSFHLELNTSIEERIAVARKLKDNDIILMGGGVIYLKNDEKEVRNAFEYARNAGMPVMVASPDIDALPLVEKMVKEFNIPVAIHNHGPGDGKYPSPLDAYKYASEYDKRIGLCIDVGHTVRWGDDEIEVIQEVKDRLYDFHVKDVTARNKDGQTVAIGRGIIDIPGVLKALLEINFKGHVALEYEADADDPLPGMCESFGYIRGALAAM